MRADRPSGHVDAAENTEELDMFLGLTRAASRFRTWQAWRGAVFVMLGLGVLLSMKVSGEESAANEKRIIGGTANLTEVSTGLTFPARIDTGAETCSLHVEKLEISDKTRKRVQNIGKSVRFLLKGADGKTKWTEAIIASAVRVKSSALKSGEYDHRYKVRLTLQWKDIRKEVLVTLNDRTSMEYPLLVGRNFLHGDFLVDVDKKEVD
jgi:hypothetical protein